MDMTTKRTPRPRDPVQLGKLMIDIMTGQVPDSVDDGKDESTQASGKHGGEARARSLTAEQRAMIARKAAKDRWGTKTLVRVTKERT